MTKTPVPATLNGLVRRVVTIASAGLVVGGIAGWLGLIFSATKEPSAVAGTEAGSFWVLALVLPLTLLVSFLPDVQTKGKSFFASSSEAYIYMLAAGIIGGVAGCLIFFVAATNVPAIFGGVDSAGISSELLAKVGWFTPVVVVVLTAAAGLCVAAYYQGQFGNSRK